DSADIHGIDMFQAAVAQLLKQEQFEQLDCLADGYRAQKAKFSGGLWKLHTLYFSLNDPRVGHATDEDWKIHLGRLERWTTVRPASITARVALAKAYFGYASFARGDGTADTVSETGWRLHAERIAKAKQILEQASTLTSKCPEWYLGMQEIALGLQWKADEETALLQRAIAFDPSYYYYYRMHAAYLLPKWMGKPGDASRFAEQSADRLGGKAGDILYFQIAQKIVCACNEPEFAGLSWPRMKRGYLALEQESGFSMTNLNLFTLMAVEAQDSEAANDGFTRIGGNWSRDTWMTEEFFRGTKDWASHSAVADARFRTIKEAAQANMQTVEGPQYKKEFDQKFASLMKPCVESEGGDLEKFEFMVQVEKDGGIHDVWVPRLTAVSRCLFTALTMVHQRQEKPFPLPPKPEYWVHLDLDPSTFVVASK
ncbi:MAG TPA: hypothetical protein VI386_00940, partial [Candidatus Sulfotelmatobacter sp.]